MVRSKAKIQGKQASGKRPRPWPINIRKIGGRPAPAEEIDELSINSPRPFKSPRLAVKKPRLSLEDLPTEILEKIAWLSLNPNVNAVSRTICSKLPDPEAFKIDVLMLAFCGWASVENKLELEAIPWITKAAANDLIITNSDEKDFLQLIYLESSWCNLDILKKAALRLAQSWLKRHWSDRLTTATKLTEYRRWMNGKVDILRIKPSAFFKDNHRHHFLQICNFSKMQVCCSGLHNGFANDALQCSLQNQNLNFATRQIPSRLLKAPFTDEKLDLLIFLRCCRGCTAVDTPDCSLRQVNDAIFEAIEHDNERVLVVLMEMRESIVDHPGLFDIFRHSDLQNQIRDMLLSAVCQKKYNILMILLKCLLDRSFDSSEMLDRVLWYAERDRVAGHQGAVDFWRFHHGYGYQLLGRPRKPARMYLRLKYPVDHMMEGEQLYGPSDSFVWTI